MRASACDSIQLRSWRSGEIHNSSEPSAPTSRSASARSENTPYRPRCMSPSTSENSAARTPATLPRTRYVAAGIDRGAGVDVVGIRSAPLHPRFFVPVEGGVRGIAELELGLQCHHELARDVSCAQRAGRSPTRGTASSPSSRADVAEPPAEGAPRSRRIEVVVDHAFILPGRRPGALGGASRRPGWPASCPNTAKGCVMVETPRAIPGYRRLSGLGAGRFKS